MLSILTQARNSIISRRFDSVKNRVYYKLNISVFLLFLLFIPQMEGVAQNQRITQAVRGKVLDRATHQPLPGVHVVVLDTEPQKAAITDLEGQFTIQELPIGRYNIKASFVGYNPLILPEILVGSGKEVFLNIPLEEAVTTLEGVEIVAKTIKDQAQNPLAFVSSRSFTVEEASRYAGGFDDPGRMAAVFPGVGGSGGAANNAMAIRGNSPKGILWRVEGIEVPNPNHFSGANIAGGGMVSVLSAQVLDNSDFFTGAFPAEYGNALSGVFDMRFRKGSNQKRKYGVQLGIIGLDAFAEGPFIKGKKASYLFNYRYSTLGLVKKINPDMEFLPEFQDLSFKMNFPAKKAGEFAFWGLGAWDRSVTSKSYEPENWQFNEDWESYLFKHAMGAAGLSHKYNLGKSTFINTTFAASGKGIILGVSKFDTTGSLNDSLQQNYTNLRHTLSSYVQHKFSVRHLNRTGVILNRDQYDMHLKVTPTAARQWRELVSEKDAVFNNQFYSQSMFSLTSKTIFNIGFHSQWFALNEQLTFEPRVGLNWEFLPSNSFSFGYGNHSRIEPLPIYFVKTENGMANKNLKLSRAHHFVFGYDKRFNTDKRLKMEVYYQHLYDIPMVENTAYSIINFSQEFAFDDVLNNNGLGRNYGIELTFERFLKNGFYYLLTSSLFDSKYSNDGGTSWYNTRFNYGYIFNGLIGKEFTPYKNKNKVVGINLRITAQGTERTSPLDQEASIANQKIVYNDLVPFSNRGQNVFFFDLSISQKANRAKYSTSWGLQVKNLLASEGEFVHKFNYVDQKAELSSAKVVVPNLFYKVQF